MVGFLGASTLLEKEAVPTATCPPHTAKEIRNSRATKRYFVIILDLQKICKNIRDFLLYTHKHFWKKSLKWLAEYLCSIFKALGSAPSTCTPIYFLPHKNPTVKPGIVAQVCNPSIQGRNWASLDFTERSCLIKQQQKSRWPLQTASEGDAPGCRCLYRS